MLADRIREAVPRTLRKDLPHLAGTLWKAYAAGAIAEGEAQAIADAIEAAKAPIAAPVARAAPWRGGSRPRTSESLERRRRWAAAGRLPPQLAAAFTLAEAAVLAVVAVQVDRGGDCRLTIGHLAALAGVSATTVRNALREARRIGLVTIEERRLSGWRNASNVVRIVSPEWLAWCRLRAPVGGGCKIAKPTNTDFQKPSTIERTARILAGRWERPIAGTRSGRSRGGLSTRPVRAD